MPHAETTIADVRAANGRPIAYHGSGFTLTGSIATISPSGVRATSKPITRPAPVPASKPVPVPTFAPKPESDREFLAKLAASIYSRPAAAPPTISKPGEQSFAELANHVYERMNRHG